MEQSHYLSVLTQIPAQDVKNFTDSILDKLGDIEIISNRTGLVMVPYADSVEGVNFHVGEVLVAEARVKVAGQEGYAACVGRDLQQALAIAILDAALQVNLMTSEIESFVYWEEEKQVKQENELLRNIEATRVEMETF